MKVEPYFTVSEAVARLKALKDAVGGSDPFLIGSDPRVFRVCDIQLERSGKADVYHAVSRGGRPVAVVKATGDKAQLLTVDAAITRLEELAEAAGTDTMPFLAQGSREGEFMLCDLWSGRVGLSDMFRSVSRGGRPIVSVALYPPTKV
jgi:Tol biopolymer transport system component